MLGRREFFRRSAGVAAVLGAGRLLGMTTRTRQAVASPAPLPTPETTTIRIGCNSCDAPIMIAEYYLRQEGFTKVEVTDGAAGQTLANGRIDMDVMFPSSLANNLEQGQRVVALAGLHPGCAEIWAPQHIRSLKDLRGKTIVVRSKVLGNLGYTYPAIVLKHAGVDPADVNFVVQADADPVRLYLDGKNDAVFVATTGAAALAANPANKGHIVHSQINDNPWAKLDCCLLVTTREWYRANPAATKHALRAIFRSADFQPHNRAGAVKFATGNGLFGGPKNYQNVLSAANMVPANWRELDAEKSVRFHGRLLADVGMLKISVDELVTAVDLRILRELRAELKKY